MPAAAPRPGTMAGRRWGPALLPAVVRSPSVTAAGPFSWEVTSWDPCAPSPAWSPDIPLCPSLHWVGEPAPPGMEGYLHVPILAWPQGLFCTPSLTSSTSSQHRPKTTNGSILSCSHEAAPTITRSPMHPVSLTPAGTGQAPRVAPVGVTRSLGPAQLSPGPVGFCTSVCWDEQ